MKDPLEQINRTIKRIEKSTRPPSLPTAIVAWSTQSATNLQKTMKKSLSPLPEIARQLQERLAPLSSLADTLLRHYQPAIREFYKSIEETAQKLAVAAKRWQENRKTEVAAMAEQGWFPNWYTFYYRTETEPETIDELMTGHLEQSWEELTARIIELCPNRAHLLQDAFDLHTEGRYSASILLMLAQTDGICSEEYSHFFSGSPKAPAVILGQAETGGLETTFLTEILLEPFKQDLQVSKSQNKASQAAKEKGPNRHGIAHGSRKHLDYNTKRNSLKAFSLLAFIVYTTKDVFKKADTQ